MPKLVQFIGSIASVIALVVTAFIYFNSDSLLERSVAMVASVLFAGMTLIAFINARREQREGSSDPLHASCIETPWCSIVGGPLEFGPEFVRLRDPLPLRFQLELRITSGPKERSLRCSLDEFQLHSCPSEVDLTGVDLELGNRPAGDRHRAYAGVREPVFVAAGEARELRIRFDVPVPISEVENKFGAIWNLRNVQLAFTVEDKVGGSVYRDKRTFDMGKVHDGLIDQAEERLLSLAQRPQNRVWVRPTLEVARRYWAGPEKSEGEDCS